MLESVAPGVFLLRGWASLNDISSNIYFLKDDAREELLLIDCGNASSQTKKDLQSAVKELGVAVKAVYCTHGHFDHVGGVNAIKAMPSEAQVFLSEKDFFLVPEAERGCFKPLKERKIEFGSFTLTVVETPGHSPGSVCFWDAERRILFSGDTLFAGGAFGRTDFPGGDERELAASLKKLGGLGWRVLLPGHDDAERV